MWQIDDAQLQDRQFLNPTMKSSSRTFLIIVVGFLVIGCSTAKNNPEHTLGREFARSTHWKAIPSNNVNTMVYAAQDTNGCFRIRHVIHDLDVVRALLGDLAKQSPCAPKIKIFIPASLIVFRDSQDKLLCGFLYWPAAKPPHVFLACRVEEGIGCYRVNRQEFRESYFALSDFEERMNPFLNVWSP
jgi:hypothetical protein